MSMGFSGGNGNPWESQPFAPVNKAAQNLYKGVKTDPLQSREYKTWLPQMNEASNTNYSNMGLGNSGILANALTNNQSNLLASLGQMLWGRKLGALNAWQSTPWYQMPYSGAGMTSGGIRGVSSIQFPDEGANPDSGLDIQAYAGQSGGSG